MAMVTTEHCIESYYYLWIVELSMTLSYFECLFKVTESKLENQEGN